MIRAGLLNKIISIISIRQTKSEIGAFVESKKIKYETIKASVVNKKNNRQMSNSTEIYPYSFTVTIRNHYNIVESDLVLINGDEYRIVSLDKITDNQAITMDVEKIIV